MKSMTDSLTFLSPLGFIKITGTSDSITSVSFADENQPSSSIPPLLSECKSQLNEFFNGKRKRFNLPLEPEGTDFQKLVWKNLCTIPFGETISYAQLAKQLGDIKSLRAVGAANGRNPVAILIPCHRVIGADGKLVGYAGGLWRKQWLLELEERISKGVLRLF